MDHYRLLSAHFGDCKGAKHILQILECASPSIDKEEEDLFAAVEKRGERMFFSQRKLEAYFRGTKEPYDRILDEILDCQCKLCRTQCGEPLDALKRCKNKSKENNNWILVPILIYLGKFHFVYPWLRAITADHITSKGRIRQIECKDVVEFRAHKLFDPKMDMERNLFRFAYDRVWCMFNPVRFEIDAQGWVVRQDLPDWARFPYQQNENELKLPQGQSSTVTYAEIPDEYVDPSVDHRMSAYPDSIKGDNIIKPKVYRVVLKAVKVSDDKKEGMQNETLSLLAVHKNHKGADNIITLLALYTWRGSIHYVFPFVKENLADLLSKGYTRDARNEISQSALSLPDIWLWREVIGVANALKFIHQGISNPFPGDPGKVFAFHFDLKPENILVKWDPDPKKRRLQITDFGRSQIRLLDEGDEQSSSLYPGNLKYMAPEAWIRQNDTPGGNGPQDLRVLQTYDVWSLACIMLEVLIYLGAEHGQKGCGPEALKEFDEARRKEMPPVTFFTLQGTKSLVIDKVQHIRSWLAVSEPNFRGDPHSEYIDRLKDLLTKMFAFGMTDRAGSEEIVGVLEEASKEYSHSRSETDALHSKIRREFQHEQRGFKEMGWYNEKSLVSFLRIYSSPSIRHLK
ncbi:kinase-like domain-containing protein [Lasiosphaeria ovina]|uniref:Kinase-like domain-containing protein n=1 Tax=Lasiosphaeria ovina TaxID=92902 RepID=A0AAE0N3W4_9PEZI|nr:kinase-like domain-containing protein [Lasiosphaeria ovina]